VTLVRQSKGKCFSALDPFYLQGRRKSSVTVINFNDVLALLSHTRIHIFSEIAGNCCLERWCSFVFRNTHVPTRGYHRVEK